MATIRKEAYKYFAAYNPNIEEYNQEGSETAMNVRFRDYNINSRVFDVKKEFLNGVAYIDISNAAKQLFWDFISRKTSRILTDANLFVSMQIENGINPKTVFALNAVVQQGLSNDLGNELNTFRTTRNRIKKYKDYPLHIAILGIGIGAIVATRILLKYTYGVEMEEYQRTEPHFLFDIPDNLEYISIIDYKFEELQTNTYETIYANDGVTPIEIVNGNKTIERRLYFDYTECEPLNPFYIRWINRMGGYDYFMFERKQSISRKTSNSVIFSPNYRDIETAKALELRIDAKAETKVTAGAEMLNQEEFDSLKYLQFAPKIELYNKEQDKWHVVTLTKDDNTENNFISGGSLEFEFNIPTILQY